MPNDSNLHQYLCEEICKTRISFDPLLAEVSGMEILPSAELLLMIKQKKHQYAGLQMNVGRTGKKGSENTS